mgnify:CR=1 FL=1
MEILGTQGLPDDPKQAEMVMASTDSLSNEIWDLRIGPILWEKFLAAYPEELFEEDKKADYILRSKKSMGFSLQESISRKINAAIEDQMLEKAGIQQSILDSIHQSAQIAELKAYEDEGKSSKESNAALAMGIGYASGLLIYITMFIYGTMVLRGVMEEKTNRIAE